MLNSKYVSIKEVIDKFYTESGSQEEIGYGDLVRWVSEALQFVNEKPQYVRRVTGKDEFSSNLELKAFKAKLPCDLVSIEQVLINGIPARYSSSSFHHLLSPCAVGPMGAYPVSGSYTDNFGNEFDSYWSGLACSDITYDLNNECLTASVRTGTVQIAYLAMPTDEEGFPLIPDDVSYIEAITFYLTMKLDLMNWRKNPDSSGYKALYDNSQREWNWYVGQAKAKAKMLSVDQMESLRNAMVRLLHKSNQHATGFRNLGNRENLRRH
jgi:hypothetical protein